MTKQAKYPVKAANGGLTLYALRFFPNTAADPSVEDVDGIVSSVVHSATGKYTVTLDESPRDIVAVLCSMSVVGDSTQATAQGGVEGSGTVIVKTKAGATNTDFAADADTHVDVLILARDSLKGV